MWRAYKELDRVRHLLSGRQKLERKLGYKQLIGDLKSWSRHRASGLSYRSKSITRHNVDAAALEHGSGWNQIRSDLARQNVVLLPSAQKMLAQYEPLAFRALVELCSSNIPPPLPMPHDAVPPECYEDKKNDLDPAAMLQLRRLVEELNANQSVVSGTGMEAWLGAWNEFQQVDRSRRLGTNHLETVEEFQSKIQLEL